MSLFFVLLLHNLNTFQDKKPLRLNLLRLGETEYFIDRIEDFRLNRRRKRYEYLVKWTGHDIPTWEPASSMKDTAAVADYHHRYPDIPEPPDAT
jgi:hypothetical protein